MKNLVLVGFMGSGKTKAGTLAAQRLGMTFVDMDALIEQREGMSISRIFAVRQEAYFRRKERELVRELAAGQDQVIATGGGVVLDPENISDFRQSAVIIYCWVDAQVAYERTKHASHRPLLENLPNRLSRIESLMREREPLYRDIPNRIDTSSMTVEQQADELVRIYKQQAGDDTGR